MIPGFLIAIVGTKCTRQSGEFDMFERDKSKKTHVALCKSCGKPLKKKGKKHYECVNPKCSNPGMARGIDLG